MANTEEPSHNKDMEQLSMYSDKYFKDVDDRFFSPFQRNPKILSTISKLIQVAILRFLALGPMPGHLALIIDGNRRYAKQRGLDPERGHGYGLAVLRHLFFWARLAKCNIVTLYLLSIANFRRGTEVVKLFGFLKYKLLQMLEWQQRTPKPQLCTVRWCGDLYMCPEDVQDLLREIEGKDVNKLDHDFLLNVCIAYTSTAEIAASIRSLLKKIDAGKLTESGVNYTSLMQHTYMSHCPCPSINMRPSGVRRLSNFQLFQSKMSYLHFCDELWPEFDFLDFIKMIVLYQCEARLLLGIQKACANSGAVDLLRVRVRRCRLSVTMWALLIGFVMMSYVSAIGWVLARSRF